MMEQNNIYGRHKYYHMTLEFKFENDEITITFDSLRNSMVSKSIAVKRTQYAQPLLID